MSIPIAIHGGSMMNNISQALLTTAIFAFWFLPAVIAIWRAHHNRLAICVLTLLMVVILPIAAWLGSGEPALGIIVTALCIPGWLVALIWSITKVERVAS
jgi:hypothetical protein